jgi:hypothetical protein
MTNYSSSVAFLFALNSAPKMQQRVPLLPCVATLAREAPFRYRMGKQWPVKCKHCWIRSRTRCLSEPARCIRITSSTPATGTTSFPSLTRRTSFACHTAEMANVPSWLRRRRPSYARRPRMWIRVLRRWARKVSDHPNS